MDDKATYVLRLEYATIIDPDALVQDVTVESDAVTPVQDIADESDVVTLVSVETDSVQDVAVESDAVAPVQNIPVESDPVVLVHDTVLPESHKPLDAAFPIERTHHGRTAVTPTHRPFSHDGSRVVGHNGVIASTPHVTLYALPDRPLNAVQPNPQVKAESDQPSKPERIQTCTIS